MATNFLFLRKLLSYHILFENDQVKFKTGIGFKCFFP